MAPCWTLWRMEKNELSLSLGKACCSGPWEAGWTCAKGKDSTKIVFIGQGVLQLLRMRTGHIGCYSVILGSHQASACCCEVPCQLSLWGTMPAILSTDGNE